MSRYREARTGSGVLSGAHAWGALVREVVSAGPACAVSGRRALAAGLLLVLLPARLPAGAGRRKGQGQGVSVGGDLSQGGVARISAPGAEALFLDGRRVPLTPEGDALAGFSRDHAGEARFTVRYPDGTTRAISVAIAPVTYDIESIGGLARAHVTPPASALARIRREAGQLRGTRRDRGNPPRWPGGFVRPAQGRISGVYGSQRILNGQPRRPHYGLDIAAPTGTPVLAPAGGVVLLAMENLYYTGGTLVIDHGHGLTSILAHLSRLDVATGRTVARGEAVAAIGATGRATGPHLHWGVYWFDIPVDPWRLLAR